jgi:hypothetical protein
MDINLVVIYNVPTEKLYNYTRPNNACSDNFYSIWWGYRHMKVFISWSGELSRSVAEHLYEWVNSTIQGIECWMSSDDIKKGSVSIVDLNKQIAVSTIGIICLTPENKNAPWVLFEAGALAKGLPTNKVCPLLIKLAPSDLEPPLAHFQWTRPDKKNDMWNLIETINEHRNKDKITTEI